MRKDTSGNKQQIRSKAERETRDGFEFHIGIDLGDKNSDVCVLDQSGEVSKEFRLRMKEADFRTYFASITRSRVAIEAGGQSRWVAEVVHTGLRLNPRLSLTSPVCLCRCHPRYQRPSDRDSTFAGRQEQGPALPENL